MAAVARVGVQFTRLGVLIAGSFGEMLRLDGLSLRVGPSLARLGSAFLGFSLGTLCFGSLLIGRGAGAFGLDRAASGLLAKLARLLTTTLITPVAQGASDDDGENQHHHHSRDNNDDRCCAHEIRGVDVIGMTRSCRPCDSRIRRL